MLRLVEFILVWLVAGLSSFNLVCADTIATSHDLDAALEAAVQCRPEAWNSLVESSLDSGSQTFRSPGIVERSTDTETAYLLPTGTKVFGYVATRAWQINTSIDVFYVELTGGADAVRHLKDRLKLVAPSADSPYGYIDYLKARFVKIISPRTPNGNVDDRAIILGNGYRDNRRYVAIGCWFYSGDPG
ncbi:hypothetical protein [Burkholderia sp. Ax-1719]|uniref:hypothetical protein n=1 Tax=Burkholderia sp. Ax-1719 TaxID=2608334 RepID=UPI0014210FED|nr:hypothetical protein [Burkholderia sp. Ax-1719]NIE64349.1 hypothetical protein [Burkholderia sp. Ax-1719]